MTIQLTSSSQRDVLIEGGRLDYVSNLVSESGNLRVWRIQHERHSIRQAGARAARRLDHG